MQQYGDSAQRHRWKKKKLTTVSETVYHDHDMQTDTAFDHLEQITERTPQET